MLRETQLAVLRGIVGVVEAAAGEEVVAGAVVAVDVGADVDAVHSEDVGPWGSITAPPQCA